MTNNSRHLKEISDLHGRFMVHYDCPCIDLREAAEVEGVDPNSILCERCKGAGYLVEAISLRDIFKAVKEGI